MKIIDLREQLPQHQSKSYLKRSISDIKKIAVHHSLTDNIPGDGDVFAFARYHVNHHNWPGIGYHYIVDRDGTVYKTNPAATISYHVGNHNSYCLGICLVGDFRDYQPSEEQIKSLHDLLGDLLIAYNMKPEDILGHSEFEGYHWKKCPNIDMDQIRSEMKVRFK